jgi:hypothetical protein
MTTDYVANILAVYNGASADVMRSGIAWYANAHAFAVSLDSDVARSAAVIAVISPNTSWSANKTMALKAYANRSGEGMGFPDKVSKVSRLFAGENPADVVRGPKVTAFYHTILDPFHADVRPVIDRHAQDIADGIRNSEKTRKPPTGKRYDAYADAYREVARIVGLPAHMVQAITWESWREAHGITV